MTPEQRALTVKDVAALYAVTPARVYDWIRDGWMKPIRLPGDGPYRFLRSHLDDFNTLCRVASSTAPTTVSEGAETVGSLIGPTSNLVALDPFQRGRQSAKRPRGGGTNG